MGDFQMSKPPQEEFENYHIKLEQLLATVPEDAAEAKKKKHWI